MIKLILSFFFSINIFAFEKSPCIEIIDKKYTARNNVYFDKANIDVLGVHFKNMENALFNYAVNLALESDDYRINALERMKKDFENTTTPQGYNLLAWLIMNENYGFALTLLKRGNIDPYLRDSFGRLPPYYFKYTAPALKDEKIKDRAELKKVLAKIYAKKDIHYNKFVYKGRKCRLHLMKHVNQGHLRTYKLVDEGPAPKEKKRTEYLDVIEQ